MQKLYKKLVVLFLLFISFGNLLACNSIVSNATDMLKLVNYICVDTNITDMHADISKKMFYTVDEESKLSAYSMSKKNYPAANSISLTFKDNIDLALDTNATTVSTFNDKIFVGSLSGVKVFGYNVGALFEIDSNETTFKGRASTVYQNYILIADSGTIKIIDTSFTTLANYLNDPLDTSTTSAISSSYSITNGYVSDVHTNDGYVYISYFDSAGVGKLQRYQIFEENNFLVFENKEIFNIKASDVHVNEGYLFATYKPNDLDNSNTDPSDTFVYDINNLNTAIFNPISRKAAFHVGDRYYRIEIGYNGLNIYKKGTDIIVASDDSFQGDKILSVGDHIMVNDFSTNYIRVYKFGKIGVNNPKGIAPFKSDFSVKKYNLKTISWDFGDGFTYNSAEQKSYHTYEKAGTYVVEINTTYIDDISDVNSFNITMDIKDSNIPTIAIGANTIRGQLPLKIDFNSTISYDRYIDSIKWNLGDGKVSYLPTFEHTFNSVGEYNVSLSVFYDSDKNVTTSVMVQVVDGGSISVVYPNGSDIASINDLLSFDYKLPTIISENNVSSIQWNFGDGGTSNVSNSKYIYKKSGVYVVFLSIITIDGDIYTISKDITVYEDALHYIEATPFIGESPLDVSYNIKTSTTSVSGVSFLKSATCYSSDGGVSYSDSFFKTYKKEGSYRVTCNVVLNDNSKKVLTKDITVSNDISLSIIPINSNIIEGSGVSFIATANTRSGVKNITWKFGDNSEYIGSSVNHIYSKEGIYRGSATLVTNKNHIIQKNFIVNVTKKPEKTETKKPETNKIKKTEVSIYTTQLDSIYSYRFNAIIEDYTKDISSYWWEFKNNIKSSINRTTAEYVFSTTSTRFIVFKVKYIDDSISSHPYTFTPSYNKLDLVLKKGWNLISAPIDVSFSTSSSDVKSTSGTLSMNILRTNTTPMLWVYTNNRWLNNPKYIPNRAGIWIKSSIDNKKISFSDGNSYKPNIASLPRGKWSLVGTGSDIVDFQRKYDFYIEKSFIFENTFFTPDPYLIRRGQGIWIYTRP
jgi:PKD repeat protein